MVELLKLPIKVNFELARLFRNVTDLVEGIVATAKQEVPETSINKARLGPLYFTNKFSFSIVL